MSMLGRGQEQVNAEWIVLSLWWVEVYRGEPGLRPRFAPIKFSFIQTGVPALFIDLGLRTDKLIGNDEKMATTYHSPKDDADQPIDYETSSRFAPFAAV